MDHVGRIRVLWDALERCGVTIREEPLPEELRSDGGLCFLRGEPIVFVSPEAPLADRVRVLADALRRVGADRIWLPPAVRALVDDEGC